MQVYVPMSNRRNIWQDEELELIVADYFDMLQRELEGQPFNKAEHRRMLEAQLGRSKGSIEYKHQNISAVMEILGLPFIGGYLPARNYQTRLFKVVEAKLEANDLAACLSQPAGKIALPPEAGITFDNPPKKIKRPSSINPAIDALLRKWDPAIRDASARELGEAGESYLFQAEQNRLSSLGRDDLAQQVRWISKEDGDGAGYDIRSYTAQGEERWLEVKTTNGPNTTPFWISRNELRISEQNPTPFRLVRLYHFSRTPAAYRLHPPLSDHVHLIATQYRASF